MALAQSDAAQFIALANQAKENPEALKIRLYREGLEKALTEVGDLRFVPHTCRRSLWGWISIVDCRWLEMSVMLTEKERISIYRRLSVGLSGLCIFISGFAFRSSGLNSLKSVNCFVRWLLCWWVQLVLLEA